MEYVYILRNDRTRRLYFGRTNDLKRRIRDHRRGVGSPTTHRGPWTLVYYEAYRDARDAHRRERMIKQYGNSRANLKKRLAGSLL